MYSFDFYLCCFLLRRDIAAPKPTTPKPTAVAVFDSEDVFGSSCFFSTTGVSSEGVSIFGKAFSSFFSSNLGKAFSTVFGTSFL